MPDLLIELFSEEIPARMQRRAAADLQRLVTDGLVEAGLPYEGAKAFATPRRLALNVEGLPARSPDTREERKGPRIDAPEKAVAGFLRGAGLDGIDQCETREDKKGAHYVAVIERPGRPAPAIIAEVVEGAVRGFPWAKPMRWGAGDLRWVRPLHSILATFGARGEDTETVEIAVDGVACGNTTRGHRMMAPGPITVTRFEDYAEKLEAAKVEIDLDRRKDMILTDARTLAMAQGLELVEDPGLLEEVAGLVEWPVVLIGRFDDAFLELPPEVLTTSMRTHQRYFALRPQGGNRLASQFIVVANVEAADGGTAIIAGNERVLAARLADARFFWEQDLKVKLDARVEALNTVTFHEKLGTQAERVERIARLARELAPVVGADPDKAERAARLAKADLVTGMVGEFPELQGLMGRYYAEHQGEDPEVAAAIEEHYRPQGPADPVPAAPVSLAVALADKLDMLVGFWAIDEKPTGSKDPYALRRAALGIVRMVLDNALRLPLLDYLARPFHDAHAHLAGAKFDSAMTSLTRIETELGRSRRSEDLGDELLFKDAVAGLPLALADRVHSDTLDLLSFFADRLKVHLREDGKRHDLVDAVFALDGQDDLLLIVHRVEALETFLKSDDGANLLIGVKRAANILRAEEKKDGKGAFDGAPDPALFATGEERRLFEAIGAATGEASAALQLEDFADAMLATARLRAPVDAFFDQVTVNADDPDQRANRLKLLNTIRETTRRIAEFSRIEG